MMSENVNNIPCTSNWFENFLCPLLSRIAWCLLLLLSFLTATTSARAMTIGEERKIGRQLLYSVRSEFQLLDDPDISQYINELGHKVLTVAGPQYFDYHFFVVESDQFNAFAAPAGLVFFYTGLIETMQSEDELVSVLAHEIGHVASRHIAQRIEKSGKINAATMAIGIASLALGIPELSQGLLAGSMAAGQALNLRYSRVDEEEADRLSFGWMQALQRDPSSMEGMLQTMRRITRYRSDQLPQYLLTHPNPEARLDYVQSLLEIEKRKHHDSDFYPALESFPFLRFKYRVLVQAKDPESVRALCANILANSENEEQRIMARYALALLHANEHNFAEALKQMDLVRARFMDNDLFKVDTAVIILDAGRVGEAVTLLQDIVQRDPTNMYAVFQLARGLQKEQKYQAAEQYLHKVTKVMPEYSQVYYELGRISADTGRTGLSTFFLGKYYLYEGKISQARHHLSRAERDVTVAELYREEAKALLAELDELEKQ